MPRVGHKESAMKKLMLMFAAMVLMGSAVAGCRAEGEVDVRAPRQPVHVG